MRKMISKIVSCIAVILMLLSCSKADPPIVTEPGVDVEIELASVTTAEISNITTISAVAGGKVVNKGGAAVTETGLVASKQTNPTIDDLKFGIVSAKGDGSFISNLSGLDHSTQYYVRAYAVNKGGVSYGNEIIFSTVRIGAAEFTLQPMFIIGSTVASIDVDIIKDGGDDITERGICWGISPDPIKEENSAKDPATGLGKYRGNLVNLSEQTEYYVRAYAVNESGISYSDNYKFKTIKRGNVTYTFNKAESPTEEQLTAYARLQIAIDSAVWYANNYTSATKHVWLNYVPDVPTADANNEGWMRFGREAGFQNIRTMLHEMNHTFGTGTTSWWSGTAISGGKYQLTHANVMLQKITGDANAAISGDNMHWWPYGLNQNSEVTSSWDFVYNCLIIEAMRRDGLTHSGSWSE